MGASTIAADARGRPASARNTTRTTPLTIFFIDSEN
jgi:hypothetical protein